MNQLQIIVKKNYKTKKIVKNFLCKKNFSINLDCFDND